MEINSTHLIVLRHLANKGGMGNVMEALNFDVTKFDEGFSIALDMDNGNLVKLLYSNVNKNLIVVEMTLPGHHAIQ